MDGLEWDIPDTKPNAAAFGFPGTGKDSSPAAFPKARAVTIGECASHAPVLAAIGPCVSKGSGEQSLARQLYPHLREDWLLIADRNFYGGMGYSGDSAMRQLTEDTGGRVIQVGNKPDKLKAAFDQIANELRSQYGIGYTPTNLKKDGSFRKIEVRSKEGYKVQARRGYYAIQQED